MIKHNLVCLGFMLCCFGAGHPLLYCYCVIAVFCIPLIFDYVRGVIITFVRMRAARVE